MNLQTLISCEQLNDFQDAGDLLVFDCRFDLSDVNRGERDYRESHIRGAFYAHLDRHLSSPITADSGRHPMPDERALLDWLGQCGMHDKMQVVVYDDSFGAMASRLWWLLKCLGHDRVALLDGGWQAWSKGGYTVDADTTTAQARHYSARLNPDCVVSTAQVLNNVQDKAFLLVDVRSHERFIAEVEPIDPVAGHIPGAVNLPLTENLDQDGFYKSTDDLRALYAPLLERYPASRQVYMCGSGVTACHSLLALSLAGFERPRVYAGSWSEWIRDPEREVASGEA